MSPLWRDQVRIALCPDQLIWVRLSRGLRPRILDKHIFSADRSIGGAPWQPVMEELKREVRTYKGSRADAVLVLSSHFVRFTLAPWSDLMTEDAEEEALARACFEDIYGAIAKQWGIRTVRTGYGLPALAGAVDARLIDELTALFSRGRLALTSIVPYFIAAYNQWRRRLAPGPCGFLVAEPGRAVFASVGAKTWNGVRGYSIQGELKDEIPALLGRESLLGGYASGAPVYLHAPLAPQLRETDLAEARIHRLTLSARPGFSPQADAGVAMALGGLP